jgi:hypothetical protein
MGRVVGQDRFDGVFAYRPCIVDALRPPPNYISW